MPDDELEAYFHNLSNEQLSRGLVIIAERLSSGSEPPVVRRAGPPVGLLDVNFCDPGIMLDHFQRTVPQ